MPDVHSGPTLSPSDVPKFLQAPSKNANFAELPLFFFPLYPFLFLKITNPLDYNRITIHLYASISLGIQKTLFFLNQEFQISLAILLLKYQISDNNLRSSKLRGPRCS